MRPDAPDGNDHSAGGARSPGPSNRWTRTTNITLIVGIVAVQVVVAAVLIGAVTSDAHSGRAEPAPPAVSPPVPPPVASLPSAPPTTDPVPAVRTPRPAPTATWLAWRTETLSSGARLLVIGDVDAVPRDPAAVSGDDYRAAERRGDVKIVRARGWWCVTKVEAGLSVSGGRLRAPGFATQCSGRPNRMRQLHRFERSSWTGMRPYTTDLATPWTHDQRQTGGPQSAPCPAGRTGTYDYRLRVLIQIGGHPVGEVPALSDDRFRGDCGTGAG